MSTVGQLLAGAPIDRREAEILLLACVERDRTWLFTHSDEVLTPAQAARWQDWLQRRQAGEPLAYLTGRRDFWSLTLTVSPAVLIPRPDTELLVELALARIEAGDDRRVLDLGTGSGAVALAIKSSCADADVTAADVSQQALEVAMGNGGRLDLPVRWVRSDWFAAFAGERWPLIVSNPPYIRASDPHLSQGDLPAEPIGALASGQDGLEALRHLIDAAPAHLEPGGWLLLEHGYGQGADVRALLTDRGFVQVSTQRDLSGHERVSGGCWHVG